MKYILLLWLTQVLVVTANAQDAPLQPFNKRTGIALGYASQFLLPKIYTYRVATLQMIHNRLLLHQKKWALELHGSIQCNATFFRDAAGVGKLEAGLEAIGNLGPQLRYTVAKNSDLYLLVCSGPGFISDGPQRQHRGYVFATSFAIGILHKQLGKQPLDMQLRLRHISNLGITTPNGGLNDMGVVFIFYPFKNS